jgi:hypothetical protein
LLMKKRLLIEKHFISRNTILGLFREFFAVNSHGPHTPLHIHTSFAKYPSLQ